MKLFRLCDSNKGRCQKKTGLCGKNSKTGGGGEGGLTKTHFLMTI